MPTPPNVVVIVADTTRVDDAYDPAVAPTLSALAESGTRATQAFSTAPWTLPSHASLLTGTHSSKHGAHAAHERLDDRLPILSECFSDAGYETACVSGNTWLSAESGFDRGFDRFQQMWQVVQSENSLSELVDVTDESRWRAVARGMSDGSLFANATNVLYHYFYRTRLKEEAERTTNWIGNWLQDRPDYKPFFLLVNYLEPHLEYRPPKRLAERFLPEDATYEEAMAVPQEPWEYLAGNQEITDREFRLLRALYRAEIAYVDEQIDQLRSHLASAGALENTVFVVTADHGENIGDHGLMDHQYSLHDTLIHVPLVLSGGSFDDGGDLTDLVSLVDLAPTLLDEAEIKAPVARESFQGRSFHPDAAVDPREFVVSEYMEPQPSMDALERNVGELTPQLTQYDRSLRAIRTADHKLVRGSDGTQALYDFAADPSETADVSPAAPEIAGELAAKLDDWLASFEQATTDESVAITGDRKNRLEQLGYLQ